MHGSVMRHGAARLHEPGIPREYVLLLAVCLALVNQGICVCQHTSAYVSIRQQVVENMSCCSHVLCAFHTVISYIHSGT